MPATTIDSFEIKEQYGISQRGMVVVLDCMVDPVAVGEVATVTRPDGTELRCVIDVVKSHGSVSSMLLRTADGGGIPRGSVVKW